MNGGSFPDGIRMQVDASLVVLIWLVQVIIYPSFLSAAPERFPAWHQGYGARITWFVVPLMFLQAGVTGWAVVRSPGGWNLLAAVAIVAAWVSTFLLSVPCHAALSRGGWDEAVIRRLIGTNWLRTLAWTVAWWAGRMAVRG